MKRLWFLLITALIWLLPLQMVAVGATTTVGVSATILSKNKCQFVTKNPVIDFGTLDPSNAVVKNKSALVSFVCNGSANPATYTMSDNGGLDSYNMTNTSDPAQKIPYSLSITPASGSGLIKGTSYDVSINATIQGTAYQTVAVGIYSDDVILTLLP